MLQACRFPIDFLGVCVLYYQELRTRKTLSHAILPSLRNSVSEKGPALRAAREAFGLVDDRPLSLPVLLAPFSGHLRADQLQPRSGAQTDSAALSRLCRPGLRPGPGPAVG